MHVLHAEDGDWQHEETTPEDASARAAGGGVTWIRAGGDLDALDAVGKTLGLHPLALEDVRSTRQRPKVEDYGDVTFVVTRIPRRGDDAPDWQQVGLFMGPGYVVSASLVPVPELDAVQRRLLAKGLPAERRSPAHVLHLLLDAVVDAWFPYMDDLEDQIEDLEQAAGEDASQDVLAGIRATKQHVSRIRKVSTPMRDACLSLERGEHQGITGSVHIYLRDVSDHMTRLVERLEHVKEMALIAQESWNATLANQQNQVMKRLTVVAALLLLPSLVAGLGGMNFERGFPDWGYWQVTGSIVAFVAVGMGVAAWRRWL